MYNDTIAVKMYVSPTIQEHGSGRRYITSGSKPNEHGIHDRQVKVDEETNPFGEEAQVIYKFFDQAVLLRKLQTQEACSSAARVRVVVADRYCRSTDEHSYSRYGTLRDRDSSVRKRRLRWHHPSI